MQKIQLGSDVQEVLWPTQTEGWATADATSRRKERDAQAGGVIFALALKP